MSLQCICCCIRRSNRLSYLRHANNPVKHWGKNELYTPLSNSEESIKMNEVTHISLLIFSQILQLGSTENCTCAVSQLTDVFLTFNRYIYSLGYHKFFATLFSEADGLGSKSC